MSDGEVIICAEKLTRQFKQTIALRDLDLSIECGEIFGLVGPDGAGKTTALRLMAAVMTPTAGKVTVSGFDSVKQAEAIRLRVGYMPQRFSLYGDLSVQENLEFYADIFGVHGEERRRRFEQVLNFSRMAPFVDRRAGALSGGMQKKLGLACTLIHRPDVLLLDEPTTGVDPVSRREFWDILTDLHLHGTTIVISTPYMDEAERCNRIGLLFKGQLIELDTPRAIKAMVRGQVLEVQPDRLAEAQAVLRAHPDVLEVQVYGNLLHVFVDDANASLPRLQQACEANGVTLNHARLIHPRMEEAFISLIGEEASNVNTPGSSFAIETDQLTKRFGHFVAVNGVTFNVPRGSIFGFLGPNGAGKTTTMRVLLGLLAPTSGHATILGYNVAHQPRAVKKHIGYMSQRFSLYDDLTVTENLRFFGRTYGLGGDRLRARIQFVVEMADLVGREKSRARELSGGWRQRLALGAAILHEPELVFLDEPTAGVDPVSRRTFWELLYRLANGGTTIFVTTHYMDEAEHCQELAFIHAGQIVAQGSPAELKVSLMAGQVIEISPNDPPEAMRLLKIAQAEGRLLADDVALYGAQIHVVTRDAAAAHDVIVATLRSGGVQFDQIDVIAPSLEDVFLSAIR